MENINLIRDIAWSFHEKSNIEYRELFSEAAVAYCEATKEFDKDRKVKFTTFAWWCMKNHLINFCKKEEKFYKTHILGSIGHGKQNHNSRRSKEKYPHMQPIPIEELLARAPKYEEDFSIERITKNWPKDCQTIAKLIMERAEQILAETPNFRRAYQATPLKSRKRIKKVLQNKGWSEDRIDQALTQMKTAVQNL